MAFNPGIGIDLYPQAIAPDWPGGFWWHWLVFTVIIIAFVLLLVMGFIWIERRGMAPYSSPHPRVFASWLA